MVKSDCDCFSIYLQVISRQKQKHITESYFIINLLPISMLESVKKIHNQVTMQGMNSIQQNEYNNIFQSICNCNHSVYLHKNVP